MSILVSVAAGFAGLALLVHWASHALALVRLSQGRAAPDRRTWPSVTLVRPLCGVEPFSPETLETSFHLTYPRHELIFCVGRAEDPTIPLVEDAMARHAHVRARLLVGEDRWSENPKLDNMAKGYRAAEGEIVVFADSNLLAPADYLQRIVSTFDDDTAVVSAPPYGSRPETLWADVECALLNAYAARVQYCVDALGFGFAQGKTLAFRKNDLDAGGFQALNAEPAEDAAATKWARASGRKVRLVSPAFPQPLGARSMNVVWSRHLRWARLRRATFPVLFAPEILSSAVIPFAAVIGAASLSGEAVAPWLCAYAFAWHGADLLASRCAGWPASARSLIALPLRDLVLFGIWCAAWTGRDFVWHGRTMNASAPDRRAHAQRGVRLSSKGL